MDPDKTHKLMQYFGRLDGQVLTPADAKIIELPCGCEHSVAGAFRDQFVTCEAHGETCVIKSRAIHLMHYVVRTE